jgi:hypothetical protein
MCAPPRKRIAVDPSHGHADEGPDRPPSAFLEWNAGSREPPLMRYLAADPQRVLGIAAEYMRLGLYRPAVDLLAREFPAIPADESEPGEALPQQHPMVPYHRGYCRERLGESGAADYVAARKLSMLYVFPHRPEDLEVLRSTIHADTDDATARYLLGTQYFSSGLTDDVLAEWNARGV